ncbi:hypothetical protein BDN72DRAFT_298390 [Pluteus cervinus]|uniref:Uncharacterized protein n=1 Tax=Pluteus cervinus TaxID=181527 RepID=A0ACD3AGB9_9AGAR|nr:hypothetical protein BDN72DRAFT_298390 [Pluteus cervinus]
MTKLFIPTYFHRSTAIRSSQHHERPLTIIALFITLTDLILRELATTMNRIRGTTAVDYTTYFHPTRSNSLQKWGAELTKWRPVEPFLSFTSYVMTFKLPHDFRSSHYHSNDTWNIRKNLHMRICEILPDSSYFC